MIPMCRRLPVLLIPFLLVSTAATAQTIPVLGVDDALEVATWNVEWFGSDSNGPSDEARQQANVAAVIAGAGIDLWALQEVSDTQAFDDLLATLGPDYAGTLATNSGQQRIAFVYKTAVIHPRRIEHILEDFSHDFASRPPLKLEADVTLADTTVVVTFITVHMKCCGGTDDRERRQNAAQRLKNHIDFTSLNREAVVVLGDFNDELHDTIAAGSDSPYLNFINDPDDYLFATSDLDLAGTPTFCSNTACTSGSTLDHILLTDELFTALEPGFTDRFASLISDLGGYVTNTSDHLPVYARFRFARNTAREDAPAVPSTLSLEAVYPLPFTDALTLRVTLDRPEPMTVSLYDLLGRRMLRRWFPPGIGIQDVRLEGTALASGPYVLVLEAGGRSFRRLVLHSR